MSKTARPARTGTARKRTSVKPAAKRTPAKRTKKVVAKKKSSTAKRPASKKPAAGKAAAKRPTARTVRAASRPAKSTAPRSAEKRTAKPRLPADVKLAIAAAQAKLAIDLTVLDLRDASAFTDFFIISTGANVKQVQAIADGIEASLRAKGQKPALVEGYRRGEWVLLDYFSFIVHVFLPAQRTFYALERLWGGAEPIEVTAP